MKHAHLCHDCRFWCGETGAAVGECAVKLPPWVPAFVRRTDFNDSCSLWRPADDGTDEDEPLVPVTEVQP